MSKVSTAVTVALIGLAGTAFGAVFEHGADFLSKIGLVDAPKVGAEDVASAGQQALDYLEECKSSLADAKDILEGLGEEQSQVAGFITNDLRPELLASINTFATANSPALTANELNILRSSGVTRFSPEQPTTNTNNPDLSTIGTLETRFGGLSSEIAQAQTALAADIAAVEANEARLERTYQSLGVSF